MDTKKLSDEEKMTLDIKQLTKSELYEALKTFPKNKTPGSDGLTVEFYLRSGTWLQSISKSL